MEPPPPGEAGQTQSRRVIPQPRDIGLFDSEHSAAFTGWSGYFLANAAPKMKSTLFKRRAKDQGIYTSMRVANGPPLITFDGSSPVVGMGSGVYNLSLAITRLKGGALRLEWSLTDVRSGSTYAISGSSTDPQPATCRFDHVGILAGSSLEAQRITFKSLVISFRAQPSAVSQEP